MIFNNHLDEWVTKSGVSEKITRLNVVSLDDDRQIDEKLDRNTKRRWKHSNLGKGWWVSGVDPKTGIARGIGGQFKPDVSPDKEGKYFGITDTASTPLFLDTGDPEYWSKAIADKTVSILITEGAKKAGAGLTIGIPTISIAGVTTGQKLGRLKDDLIPFFQVGRRVYLCFDSDVMTKPQVQAALDRLGRLIAEYGANVSVVKLPEDTKGMDDHIVKYGSTAFHELVKTAPTFEEWRHSLKETESTVKTESRKQQDLKNLRKLYAKHLKCNLRGQIVELEGKEIKPDYLYLQCLEKHGISVAKELIIDSFLMFANEQEYDPVKEYLMECYAKYGDRTIHLLKDAATRYLGTENDIYNTYLRKTLVGAVKRTLEPGCKFDTALVFQGTQGLKKSTFWRTLTGDNFFDDDVQGFEKDELQKLHRVWIEELGEIEKISNKNDVSVIKAFLSRQFDTFRVPFGRSPSSYPRKFIIVGSCNKVEFLQDSTGDRRFWVIPLQKEINIELVREDRDQLWAAAMALYHQGESVYLPKDLDQQREELNKIFRSDDPWEEPITDYCHNRLQVKMTEILSNCLKIDIERHDRRTQTRVAEILRNLGWEKTHTRVGKIWEKSQKDGSIGSQESQPYDTYNSSVTLISVDESQTVSVGSHKENKQNNSVTRDPNVQNGRVTPEIPTQQGLQSAVTHVTHVTQENQSSLNSNTQNDHDLPVLGDFKLGQKVEIQKGFLSGKIAKVIAIRGDEIEVRLKNGVVSQHYKPEFLRLVREVSHAY